MTELETTVDHEVGNDTEKSRLNFLKYIAYGKALQLEASNSILIVDADKAIAAASKAAALQVLSEIEAVLKKAGDAAQAVEKADEDEVMASLVAEKIADPAVLTEKFQALLDTVDAKHTAIVHERDAELAAIKAKYEPKADA